MWILLQQGIIQETIVLETNAEIRKALTQLIDGTVLAVERGAQIADETAKSLLLAVQQSGDVEAKIGDITFLCE